MLKPQHRFRFAVAGLLFAKSLEGETPVMPDDRGRAKSDDVTFLLQAPAEIDVVARFSIFNVKPADGIEGPAIKGHVTTRNVFRDRVGKENMAWSAGRGSNAGLHPVFRWRWNVWSAHTSVVSAQQSSDQVIKPVGISHAV